MHAWLCTECMHTCVVAYTQCADFILTVMDDMHMH